MFRSADMGMPIFFTLIPILIFLTFGVVIAAFILKFARGITQYKYNNNQPVLTVNATIVSKREAAYNHHHHQSNDMMSHTSTSITYYATFQVESGDRLELEIPSSDIGLLAEGDIGDLTFQGTRYLDFQRCKG